MVWAVDFYAQIDIGERERFHFDGVWNCCNSSIQPVYNFPIYDVQNLSLDSHGLSLTLTDVSGGYMIVPGSNYSSLHFDYAVVNNDTAPNATSTTINTASSHPSSSRPVSL
jgi:hypothetical protein